ncbi:MAG: TIGR04283 family arsenosugar biosynthesis glycosyltransferase [Pseudomonadota bacterium]
MPAKLSIVIPTLNAQDGLARSLPPLSEGLTTGLIRDLVISDGGSTDATLQIAQAAGAKMLEGDPSRGGQLRRGAEAADGAWLFFLHADTVLPPGWTDAVATHMNTNMTTGRPAWCPMRFDHGGLPARWVAGWANLRARVFALPYGDQTLLISREDYGRVGGFPDQPLMEDVAMARLLGRRLMPLPITVTTSAEKYLRDGWLRRGLRNLSLLLQYLGGAEPEALAKKY